MPTKAKRPKAKAKKIVKRVAKKTAAKLPKIKVVGRVVHYYDRIHVAIIELLMPLSVGDTVLFKRSTSEHTQQIYSMQIDHLQVTKAKKGDVIGVQVSREVSEGALVMPVK